MLPSPSIPFLATLFGSTVDADCVIHFTLSAEAQGRQAKRPRREASPPPRPQKDAAKKDARGKRQGSDVKPERQLGGPQRACVVEACPKSTGNGGDVAARPHDKDVNALLFIGEPIPSHRLVLRCGSERFRAYMERWEHTPPSRASDACQASIDSEAPNDVPVDVPDSQPQNNYNQTDAAANGVVCTRKRTRAAASASGCGLGLPEIPIPLGSEEELPAAMRALRFMYSGTVPSTIGFKDILNTRRMAAYLQIERCVEGCDSAMINKVTGEGAKDSATVLDAYACHQAFPSDHAFASVLVACRSCLVKHFGDALAVLNCDPARAGGLYRQFMELPAVAVEAVLASDDFGTDSESSVLLLLSRWFQANPVRPWGFRSRACRLIRVQDLTRPYLCHVLPQLDWFDATPAQRAALIALACAPSGRERACLMSSVRAAGLDLEPPLDPSLPARGEGGGCKWLAPARRNCVPYNVEPAFSWRASTDELARLAEKAARAPLVTQNGWRCQVGFVPKPAGPAAPHAAGDQATAGGRAGGAAGADGGAAAGGAPSAPAVSELPVIYAHGLRWRLVLVVSRFEPAYVQLRCRVPMLDQNIVGTQDTLRWPVRVTLQRASGRPPRPVQVLVSDGPHMVAFGVGLRLELTSPAERFQRSVAANTAGVEPNPMEPWEPYLQQDRTIRGELAFPEPCSNFGGRVASEAEHMEDDEDDGLGSPDEDDGDELDDDEIDRYRALARR